MRIMQILQALILLAAPPLGIGIVNKTKAWFAGRRGPSLFQLYYDLFKLFRKGMAISKTTTGIFFIGAASCLATPLLAGLMVPLGFPSAAVSFQGDLFVFAYLLGLGRFLTAAAALDTGSSFEGMGASRELTFSSLGEPAFFLGFIVLAMITGSISFTEIFSGLSKPPDMTTSAILLLAASWLIVLLAENCRIPFDDPNTHLELTMIHEVMVLDHSGPALGFILYGAAIKLFIMASLLVDVILIVLPVTVWIKWLAYAAGILLLYAGIGVIESIMARLKLVNVPKLLISSILLSGFAVVLLLR
ncbi:MAG: NADH-quinone oxidoreductase subunit H [Candidatus Omnitrophota bacterium]